MLSLAIPPPINDMLATSPTCTIASFVFAWPTVGCQWLYYHDRPAQITITRWTTISAKIHYCDKALYTTLSICDEAVDYDYSYGSDITTENPAFTGDDALDYNYSYGSNTAAKIPATIHYRCDEAPYTTDTAINPILPRYTRTTATDRLHTFSRPLHQLLK